MFTYFAVVVVKTLLFLCRLLLLLCSLFIVRCCSFAARSALCVCVSALLRNKIYIFVAAFLFNYKKVFCCFLCSPISPQFQMHILFTSTFLFVLHTIIKVGRDCCCGKMALLLLLWMLKRENFEETSEIFFFWGGWKWIGWKWGKDCGPWGFR